MRLVLSLFIATVCVAEEPVRLLEQPNAWVRMEGTDELFEFDGDHLRINRTDDLMGEILTTADYENFEASFEFKLDHWAETGFFIHAPRNRAYRAGLELELSDTHGAGPSPYVCGALFRKLPPLAVSVNDYDNWNTCSVSMDWPHLKVTINDVVVQDTDLSQHEFTKYALRRGAIGFQHTGWGADIRNFKVTTLPDSEGGVEMITPNSFEGFDKIHSRAEWTNTDGVLRSWDGDGYLVFDYPVQDFDFRGYIRTGPAANGGVFFRWPLDKQYDRPNRGVEIQILDIPGTSTPTASIYSYVRADDRPITPGEWELLQIHVRGTKCVTLLNGIKTAETDALRVVRKGHIALQMHRIKQWIEWKDLVLVPADTE